MWGGDPEPDGEGARRAGCRAWVVEHGRRGRDLGALVVELVDGKGVLWGLRGEDESRILSQFPLVLSIVWVGT